MGNDNGSVVGSGLTGDEDGALECDIVGIQLGDILGDADSGTLETTKVSRWALPTATHMGAPMY